MTKSRDAFRTISEVSTTLDTPTHVLRFWESKFAQIKPVKRAGGRRYYRPQDISLLTGIKVLLHDQGMTIKGAQKVLRESGVKHVMALGDAGTSTLPQTTPETPVIQDDSATSAPAAPITFTGRIAAADADHIRANAAEIAPLLIRLEALRDSIRAT